MMMMTLNKNYANNRKIII